MSLSPSSEEARIFRDDFCTIEIFVLYVSEFNQTRSVCIRLQRDIYLLICKTIWYFWILELLYRESIKHQKEGYTRLKSCLYSPVLCNITVHNLSLMCVILVYMVVPLTINRKKCIYIIYKININCFVRFVVKKFCKFQNSENCRFTKMKQKSYLELEKKVQFILIDRYRFALLPVIYKSQLHK